MACAAGKGSHPFVDKIIAGIVVGEDDEEKVMKYYGKGTLVQEGFAWCYYSTDENQYIIFELGTDKDITGITLTIDYSMECQKITTKGKMPIITSKGIRLGETPKKVKEIYGNPETQKITDGILIFEYHTDYTKDPQIIISYDAYLYFKEGRLIKLYISHGE